LPADRSGIKPLTPQGKADNIACDGRIQPVPSARRRFVKLQMRKVLKNEGVSRTGSAQFAANPWCAHNLTFPEKLLINFEDTFRFCGWRRNA
jgi:hypothetical protein